MAEEVVDLKFLIKLELMGENHVIHWCMKNKLIPNKVLCPKCGQQMRISTRLNSSGGYAWQCRTFGKANPHDVKRSIRKGSWFYDSRLPISVILKVIYMWFHKISHTFIKSELRVSDRTIIDWKMLCRKACHEICRRENGLLGGPGVVVEIGEHKFIKQRMYRGHCVEGRWVIGGVERETNKCFLKVIENQTKQILLSVIKENVSPGSIIVSDCWQAYNCLFDEDFVQLEVTDGLVLKSPERSGDTDCIEKEWVAIRKSIPAVREIDDYLESHLAEYVWRKRYGSNSHFVSFLTKIAEIEAQLPSLKHE